jgi:3-hexulose-6-phosphate synthase/6-phospho-3-hexuloisomerase
MHRKGELPGIIPVYDGIHMAGPAVTVRTYPGDWAKPVEAIDAAGEGDVLVIDAGGAGPAVWGELATHSALERKLAGVVVFGAVRDTPEIRSLEFPVFSSLVTPTAGEPKGFGELDVPVNIARNKIFPGDWIVGDDDGLVVIPRASAAEVANRAMDVLERENRLRREIRDGSTLSEVAYLQKWEKT